MGFSDIFFHIILSVKPLCIKTLLGPLKTLNFVDFLIVILGLFFFSYSKDYNLKTKSSLINMLGFLHPISHEIFEYKINLPTYLLKSSNKNI